MNTADNGSFIGAALTIHYTPASAGTPPRRVKTVCGQATRKSYFDVHTTAMTVNCKKCLDTHL